MTAFTWTVDIKRSPEDVFAYVADVRNHPEWSPTPQRIENIADGQVKVGTTFRNIGHLPPRDKNHVNECEVTRLDPPISMEITSDDRGQRFLNHFTVSATPGGARLERGMEFAPTGFVRIMMPVVGAVVIKPGVQKGMIRLRDKLEAGI